MLLLLIKQFFKNIFKHKKSTERLKPINTFDIRKFEGTWYEIARYNHWFESSLKNVYTEYRFNSKYNYFDVINSGRNSTWHKIKKINAVAKFKNQTDTSIGVLKLTFFNIFSYTYKILYVNKKWDAILVTSDTYDYFWILSKNQCIDADTLIDLINQAIDLGFEEEKMLFY